MADLDEMLLCFSLIKDLSNSQLIEIYRSISQSLRCEPLEFEYERIITYNRITKRFTVKWKGWPHFMNSDEPLININNNCEIKKYIDENCNNHVKTAKKGSQLRKIKKLYKEKIFNKVNYDPNPTISDFIAKYFEKIQYLVRMCSQPYNLNVIKLKQICNDLKFQLFNKNKRQLISRSLFEAALKHFPSRHEILQDFFDLIYGNNNEDPINSNNNFKSKLKIENTIDNEYFPNNFVFISKSILGKCTKYFAEHFGCTESCTLRLSETNGLKCCCNILNEINCGHENEEIDSMKYPVDNCCQALASGFPGEYAYNSDGIMILPVGSAIYECNDNCRCTPEFCGNRIVQINHIPHLTIFKTKNKGWALKSNEFIPKGRYITKYVGEYLEESHVVRRESRPSYNGSYILTHDFFRSQFSQLESSNDYSDFPSIDAYNYGNESRFINHSCEPNCAVFCVWTTNYHIFMPEMAIFAIKDIQSNEEIVFDYKVDFLSNKFDKVSDPHKFITCQCESKFCKNTKFRAFQ